MAKKNLLITLATIMMAVTAANYEQSSNGNFKVLATETINLFDNDVIEVVGSESFSHGSAQGQDYAGGSVDSGMSGMNHHSNQMLGSMPSHDSYVVGSALNTQSLSHARASGNSGMNYNSNQIFSTSSDGSYTTGSTERNMYTSNGAVSQRSMNMRSSSQSSGQLSKPMIRYVATEGGNSNTVFTQNSGNTGNNGYY